MHHDRDIDHPIVVLRFADLPQFLNTLNWANLSWRHTRQCTESVAPRQISAHLGAAPWPTRLTRLRYYLVRSFHVASFRVRFSIRTFPSIPHFIVSFQPTPHLLSDNIFPFQNIAKVHPPGASDLANSFLKYRWTGSSPKPCCMVVPHVHFVDDESRGDSTFQFACFLFHVIELSFDKFLFF